MGGAVSSGRDNNELIDNLMSGNYIRTLDVEKVFRALDRAEYMTPEARDQAYKDLAWRNGPLHLSSPCIYSEAMEGLLLKPGLSFLNVGSGTGYFSTLAGLILGSAGINHGVEVHPAVVDYAVKKIRLFFENSPILDDFDFCEPKFYQGNGLCINPLVAGYDRVYCGAGCPPEYENYFKRLLKVGGILVMPMNETLLQVRRVSDDTWTTRSLLSVSFASLRVPTATEAANPITLDTLTPVRLQLLARSVVRVAMRGAVTRRNPVLREQPRPARAAACPRRICIPIEAGDAEGLDVLHDLDPDNGANEMNALLSLVINMGQNRSAGSVRFDLQTDDDVAQAAQGGDAEDRADGGGRANGGNEADGADGDDRANGGNEAYGAGGGNRANGGNEADGADGGDEADGADGGDEADAADGGDEADGADGGDEAEGAEADDADDVPIPLPNYPSFSNRHRHGRYSPLLARLSTRNSPTISPRCMPMRALDSLIRNVDFHDSDEEDRLEYEACLRQHSIRRGNENVRNSAGNLIDTSAISHVNIDEMYDRQVRNSNLTYLLRTTNRNNTESLRPGNPARYLNNAGASNTGNLNNTGTMTTWTLNCSRASNTRNLNNTNVLRPENSNITNDSRPGNLNNMNSMRPAATNNTNATRPGNGCNTDTDARAGAADAPGNSRRRDNGNGHSKGCSSSGRPVPDHERVLSRSSILMSLCAPCDRPSTSAQSPTAQASSSVLPRAELPGVPSEVEIDLAKMSEASASTSTTTMEWEETGAERAASEDDAEASISKPKRQKLDSGIGENTPSGSSPKTTTENSETESRRPSERTEVRDSASEQDRLSSPFDEDSRRHDDSDSMSTIESDSGTADTEDFLNDSTSEQDRLNSPFDEDSRRHDDSDSMSTIESDSGTADTEECLNSPRTHSPSYWEPSPEEIAHAARMQRRLARGGDARRVRLSLLMKRAVRELPLPYALKKFVNLGRCFEF